MFTFSIKTKSSTLIGDTIKSRASIYFDYNLPILTNSTTNIVAAPSNPTKIYNQNQLQSLNIYPNPSSGIFNVVVPEGSNNWNLVVTDMAGNQVYKKEYNNNQIEFKLNVATGVYFVKMLNRDNGMQHVMRVTVVN
jgi:hypothetical protein